MKLLYLTYTVLGNPEGQAKKNDNGIFVRSACGNVGNV